MMWFDGGWAWMWLAMVPMMALAWALIAIVVVSWARNGTDRAPSPVERLDGRLAAGDISVDEYRSRRTELEHRS